MRWTLFAFCLFVVTNFALAQDRALPPEEAAATMKVPPGFKATLFAGEPAIVQPIAFTFDDRGRVWVVECLSYPTWKADGTGHDRVTILEDTDNDGRHDKRTVFLDNGVNLTGIEVGFGGVWLASAPNFIFIPDANGDDKPDGPAKILLDGWTLDAKHNVFGNLAWGPDGWLYGCNGITAPSFVGKPGTPENRRQKVSCGVWRYHPVRHEWEVYANGTTNPWGIDWDERGQMFITNCVIKHIFHVVPGAHFVRMFGQDPNPHVYGLIDSCADHQHWAGGHWTSARGGPTHTDFGGGHAHSGCMIYLGDNWPAEYRGNAFLVNIHGQRLNRDVLERQVRRTIVRQVPFDPADPFATEKVLGSSYVAKHAPDFTFSQDPWFRGLHAKYGPDGGVYLSDWSDTGECHDAKEEQCDKTSGRIFKIVYGRPEPFYDIADLTTASEAQLSEMQCNRSEWFARRSRRILQERAASGKLSADISTILRKAWVSASNRSFDGSEIELFRRRVLLTRHVIGALTEEQLLAEFKSRGSYIDEFDALAVTLAFESRRPSNSMLERTIELASRSAPDDRLDIGAAATARSTLPSLRLQIASALQRTPLDQRWPIATALVSHAEDADDPNLPLMYWYAIEPLVPRNTRKAIELIPQCKIPLVRQYIARRVVSVREGDGEPPASTAWMLDELLRKLAASSDDVRHDILHGLKDAYRGRRHVAAPGTWRAAYTALSASPSAEVRDSAAELGVLFGDRQLIGALEDSFYSRPRPDVAHRRRALELLATRREPAFAKTLIELLQDLELRGDAIRALAGYDAGEIPPKLINLYAALTPSQRQDAIQTLTARPIFALTLLDAIEQGLVPRADVSALTIRQLQALDDKLVSERLTNVWGAIRRASADKQARIEQFKSQLTVEELKAADLSHGRAIFTKSCATCHQLFGEGTKLAPDLTGGQRHNLEYVLDNVLDPSGIVPREYKVTVLRLADGRIVQGVISEENPQSLTVQTANETVSLPTAEIEARKESPLSMMPEGLFDRLSAEEIRDLVAYLASPQQVPLSQNSEQQK